MKTINYLFFSLLFFGLLACSKVDDVDKKDDFDLQREEEYELDDVRDHELDIEH